MRKIPISILISLVALVSMCASQDPDEQDIDRLFANLRQTLIKRAAPDALLSPTLTLSQRRSEAQKAMRPYLSVEFRYNFADLQRISPTIARLPLRFNWETARQTGSVSATARLEKVDEHWYFSDYDFTVFPWLFIFVAFSVCILASVVLYFYLRRQKQEQRLPA